jgi:hypothetical protein
MTPIPPARRLSNRAIIGFGLVLCILAALLLAYFFGFLDRFGGTA